MPSTPIKVSNFTIENPNQQHMMRGYYKDETHNGEEKPYQQNLTYRQNMLAQAQSNQHNESGHSKICVKIRWFIIEEDKLQEEAPAEAEEEDDEEKEFPPLTKERKLEIKQYEQKLSRAWNIMGQFF